MRIVTSTVALWHSWRAARHYRLYLHHLHQRAAVTAAVTRPDVLRPSERILLASLAGVVVCGVWIAITWRAWG